MRKKGILCTVGPASMNGRTIQRLDQAGVDIFRLNLSHTELVDLGSQINLIRQHTKRPICLDTEGAQIRTGRLQNNQAFLKLNSIIRCLKQPVVGNKHEMNFYPIGAYDLLQKGDLLYLDFNSAIIQVVNITPGFLEARVLAEGTVGQNKAVVLERSTCLPPLTQKDRQAIEIGASYGVEYVALSFASRASDIDELRRIAGPDIRLISKIESLSGLENLSEIISRSNAILIDRGDLGREVLVQALPFTQKAIIGRANSMGVPVYVATNLLESMVSRSQPTRAEVNDIMNTLLDGADGLVLAAETAIGNFPIECVVMIDKLIKYYEQQTSVVHLGSSLDHNNDRSLDWRSSITKNNWGVRSSNGRLKSVKNMKRLIVEEQVLMDVSQIALGAFAPLDGFMTEHQLTSVLDKYRLPNGKIWTMPVTLQIGEKDAEGFKLGDEILLSNQSDDQGCAILTITDIYAQDLRWLARKWFGTDNPEHPGVNKLLKGGSIFLGGPVVLLRRNLTPHSNYELIPTQIRDLFENRRWNVIAGFHTRNVPHRGHEKLLKLALEKHGADGVFISPVIGPKKTGDYESEVVLMSFELLIEKNYLPADKYILGAFSTYARYSGPREAVFTALCRRNFGCTHFIVGRDHTGVKDFYHEKEAQELFRELGDIGIEPLFFDTIVYCAKCDDYVDSCDHINDASGQIRRLSGTEVRTCLQKNETPPSWLMRPELSELLLHEMSQGKKIFIN